MIEAGAGFSAAETAREAAREACEAACGQLGHVDSAILFAGQGLEGSAAELLAECTSVLGTQAVVGCSAHGVLGAGCEQEGEGGVAVLAQRGLAAEPFLLTDLDGDEASAAEEIAARIGGAPTPEDLVVLLPDPRALRIDALIAGARAALEPAIVVGAGAADPLAAPSLQWCGERAESGALAGVVLRGQRPVRVGVTQACRPATELLNVTRARGNWVVELDGRPALEVYREAARGPLADDLRRAAQFVLVALPCEPGDALEPGSYRVRNVVGFAVAEQAFALPHAVSRGDRLALAVREPEAARADLKEMLEAATGARTPAALALYFDCCARGSAFFGVEGLEAAYLESALGRTPFAGMFGSCEIGPVGVGASRVTELLTYTGVLALIDA